jgi:putative ATP-dependent endonuclease of OLD family
VTTVANPPMHYGLTLAEVRVRNFRMLNDVTVALDPKTTVLVGENNTGKTSFLQALAVAFGSQRAVEEDFFRDRTTTAGEFTVDLRLRPAQGRDFPLSAGQILGSAVLLPKNNTDPEEAIVRTRVSMDERGEIQTRRSFLASWEPPVEMQEPRVAEEARRLLFFDMLDARRDIVEQLRNKRSVWGRLVRQVEVAAEKKTEMEADLKRLGSELVSHNAVLARVKAHLDALPRALSQGDLKVDVEPLPTDLEDLMRSMDVKVGASGSADFPVGSLGMGTRSLATLLVFRAAVNHSRERTAAADSMSVSAFEEPEAHLHPQAQRAVFNVLGDMSGQKVISTHSAQVAPLAGVAGIRVFRRRGARTEVRSAGDTSSWNLAQVERFLLRDNPEVLFARVVGLVEGETEGIAVPALAAKHWGPGGSLAIGGSLVALNGVRSSEHYVPLLERLGIPWVLLVDGDEEANKAVLRLAELLGRSVSASSPEVVQLPGGLDFEQYIAAQHLECIQRALGAELDDYRAKLHGQKKQKKHGQAEEIRDYKSTGWEVRLAVDLLHGKKVAHARSLAEQLCADNAIPKPVKELFERMERSARGTS